VSTMKEQQRPSLENAVKRTMDAVAKEVMQVGSEADDRLTALKKHLGKVVSLKLSEIESEENVRKGAVTESDEFEKLKVSIQQFGLLQPIVVELRLEADAFRLVCLAGHRRLAALRALGAERVQCLLLAFDEKSQRTGAALSENLTRSQLHFLDTAEGYFQLVEQGWTEERLARHFERDEKTIKRFLVMAQWSEDVKSFIRANPKKFSLRRVLHSYVQRSYATSEALLAAMQADVEGRVVEGAVQKRAGASGGTKIDTAAVSKKLDKYFQSHPEVSVEVRKQVEEALRFLKVL
jgi:ParB/RepB/Spo0J family partition protein